tara:strand:+ start:871 stop:1998 length:1128 start_codon:yes stop_codon:yes gene_type:complete
MAIGQIDHAEAEEVYDIPPDRLPVRFRLISRWRDLLAVIQAIHGLVAARMPLSDGLLELSQGAPNKVLWHIFYWLHRELQGGVTLHEAMENRCDFFPKFCVDLVRAGEESADLEGALEELREEIAEGLAWRQNVFLRLWLIGGSLFIPVVCVAGTMTFVAPQIVAIIAQLGMALPTISAWAIAMHEYGITWVLLLLAFALPTLWLATEYSFIAGGLLARDIAMLTAWVPALGSIARKRHLAGIASILGRLLRAGAPLPRALRSAASSSRSSVFSDGLLRLAYAVEDGESLTESMEKERWLLPASFRTWVALGESSGHLPEALLQIAARYRTQNQTFMRLALEIGMPLIVCLNGAIVFLVYAGLLLPIMRLVSLAE